MSERSDYKQGKGQQKQEEVRRFSQQDYEHSQRGRDEGLSNFSSNDQGIYRDEERYGQSEKYGTSFDRNMENQDSYQTRSDIRGQNAHSWNKDSGGYSGGRGHQGQAFGQQGQGMNSGREGSQFGQEFESENNFIGRGPKGYQRTDERIQEAVNDCLADHPGIDASDIEVKVEGGVVTLTGIADDRRAKRLAEDAVEKVRGVKDVANQIRIRSTQERNTTQQQSSKGQAGTKKMGESLHS